MTRARSGNGHMHRLQALDSSGAAADCSNMDSSLALPASPYGCEKPTKTTTNNHPNWPVRVGNECVPTSNEPIPAGNESEYRQRIRAQKATNLLIFGNSIRLASSTSPATRRGCNNQFATYLGTGRRRGGQFVSGGALNFEILGHNITHLANDICVEAPPLRI